jgi:hypothetical protein
MFLGDRYHYIKGYEKCNGKVEKYCIWSNSSLGGFPLEEISHQEWIPFVIGSIVQCFPTPRVLIDKVWSFYIVFYILCGDLLFIYLVLNKWYQSSFFNHEKREFFILFFIFFQEGKKRATTLWTIFVAFYV